MNLYKDGDRYIVETTYEEYRSNPAPKTARFRFDSKRKRWWTDDPEKAAVLLDHEGVWVTDVLMDELEKHRNGRSDAMQLSRATSSEFNPPVPEGLELRPFQRAGVEYMRSRSAVLLADEMGLGKTPQVIALMNVQKIANALVVCPASLKRNWERELHRWLTLDLSVAVVGAKMAKLPEADILIVNYEILHKFDGLGGRTWDLLAVDECHYVKSTKARRTKMVAALKARQTVMMSGSPMPNRHIELWSILQILKFNKWKFWTYVNRFCDAYNNGFGWDFSGSINGEELQRELRSALMVRRLKSEVLTELPAKVRQVIELPSTGLVRVIGQERGVFEQYEEAQSELEKLGRLSEEDRGGGYEERVAALRSVVQVAFEEMSRIRHETAVAKAPKVAEYVGEVLETQSKVIVFAHHRDVIDILEEGLRKYNPVRIDGGTPQNDRLDIVDQFQNDENCRVFLGSITAAGVGITLTAASYVAFAELDWVPGNVSQAEDRAHRIGQYDSVLVQHILVDGSIDAKMARTIVRKQEALEIALDRDPDAEVIEGIEETAIKAKRGTEPKKTREAQINGTLSMEMRDTIHTGLKMIAGVCDGAQALDGSGFNKVDTNFGHSLAEAPRLSEKQAQAGAKLVRKYKRQLSTWEGLSAVLEGLKSA